MLLKQWILSVATLDHASYYEGGIVAHHNNYAWCISIM